MQLGDRQSYVVYHPANRSIPGSWAAVEAENESGGGRHPTSRRGRSTKITGFCCKANGSTGCAAAKKHRSGKCVHTYVVALGVWGSEWGIETPLVMDEGEEEDSGDEGIGTGAGEYKCNTPGFIAK
ncbi:unnamed protein product, partial [Pylaiella littoralis]